MADKIKQKAARNRSGSALDKAMAAFASASVGFATSVMPADLFARLVQLSGLPVILPAARPPLGDTARLALVIAATLATFLGVWLLLRALGRKPARGKIRTPVEVVDEPPRLRRADMHPDAPSRSPISAGRELGVPLDEMSVDERAAEQVDLAAAENVDYDAEWQRPLPGFIEQEPETVVADADVVEASEVQEVQTLDESSAEPEIVANPEDSSDLPFWMPEETSADQAVEDVVEAEAEAAAEPPEPAVMPFWAEASDDKVEDAPAGEALSEPVSLVTEEQHGLDELGERLPEKQALETESIDGLVARIETGVGRRKRAGKAQSGVSVEDKKLEERLRGAISDLRKISRG